MLEETTLTRYEKELLEEQLLEDMTEEDLWYATAQPCAILYPFDRPEAA